MLAMGDFERASSPPMCSVGAELPEGAHFADPPWSIHRRIVSTFQSGVRRKCKSGSGNAPFDRAQSIERVQTRNIRARSALPENGVIVAAFDVGGKGMLRSGST
jgi:hypothetical protein